tara:strand:- start:3049 stop:3954 length:906 start_codon:yes stop_codon:yes gene_type:complete
MPKLPTIFKKPGALPATTEATEQVTKGVLDKLPQVDRREFLRGALSTIANTAMDTGALNQISKIVKPAPVAEKIPNILDFENPFDVPLIIGATKSDMVERALQGKYNKNYYGDNDTHIDFKAMAEDPSVTTDEVFEELVEYFPEPTSANQTLKKAYNWFRGGAKNNPPNEFSKDIMGQYPENSAEDIANIIGDSGEAGAKANDESKLFMNIHTKPLAINMQKNIYDWSLIPGMGKPRNFDKLSNNQKKWIYDNAITISTGSTYNNPKRVLRNISKGGADVVRENVNSLINTGTIWTGRKIK